MVDGAPSRASTFRNFVAVTGSTLLGGVMNALLIAGAARRGEIAEIAAYTVITAALAIVGVAIGGGSGLLYLSGTDDERRAIRSQRVLAVLPGLIITALTVIAFYGDRGYSLTALVASALVFIGNNFAELSGAQLYRDMRFGKSAVPILLSKAAAVAAFVVGAPLTTAMLLGAAINFATVELLAGGRSSLRAMWTDPPTIRGARRAFRSSRALHVYTLAELYALKVPSIGLSLVVPVNVVGAFGAVAAVYQALVSVFQSGLLMVLSLRSKQRPGRGDGEASQHDAEVLSFGAGLLCAAMIVVAAPWLTSTVLQLKIPQASMWLQIFAAIVPIFLFNRIIVTHAIAHARYAAAARIALWLAVVTTVSLVITIPWLGVIGGVLATLLAETAVAGTLVVRELPFTRRRVRPTES